MTQAPIMQNIPFVAGKSLNKSHNMGIRIQQTKSLMNTQLNKRSKSKQKLQLQILEVENESARQTGSNSIKTLRNNEIKISCPVLKHQQSINTEYHSENEIERRDEDTELIQEIWADYMFGVESKKIIPVKCTCYNRTHTQRQITDAQTETKYVPRIKVEKIQSSIYIEARKVMSECRVILNSSDEEMMTKDENDDKNTRTNKMAKYMRKIIQMHDRLVDQADKNLCKSDDNCILTEMGVHK